MARVLARAVRDNAPGAPHELRLLYRGTLLRLTGHELSGVRHTLLGGGAKRNAVRPKAAGHLLDALWRQAVSVLGASSVPAREEFAADTFTVQGVREVTTYADRMAAARGVAVERPADYREYAHIVVDESQDVSPMQWRMLGRRGEYASWTVVGDPAQAAWVGDPAETARARDAALGTRRRSEHVLTTNYRNSPEIFPLAADVVRKADPDIELPVAGRRTGVAPRHIVADDLPDAVRGAAADLLREADGTAGVVATQASRDAVAGWLAGLAPERLQTVTSLEAKGMEYDGVLVVEPAAILTESPAGRRALYVALSRATQRLTTVGTDDSWRD